MDGTDPKQLVACGGARPLIILVHSPGTSTVHYVSTRTSKSICQIPSSHPILDVQVIHIPCFPHTNSSSSLVIPSLPIDPWIHPSIHPGCQASIQASRHRSIHGSLPLQYPWRFPGPAKTSLTHRNTLRSPRQRLIHRILILRIDAAWQYSTTPAYRTCRTWPHDPYPNAPD